MFSDANWRLFAALCGALALAGCAAGSKSRVPADLSGPKPAALTFLNAAARGDLRTARAASVGSEQDKRWIDAMVRLVDGLRAYDRALLSRFGRDAVPADVDLKQTIMTVSQEPIAQIEEGIVREGSDSAEIDPAYKGVRLAARAPLFLRKVKGQWKVDLAAMAHDADHSPTAVKQYLAAGDALHDAARQIASGRYKTFADAERALGGRR